MRGFFEGLVTSVEATTIVLSFNVGRYARYPLRISIRIVCWQMVILISFFKLLII